MTPRKTTQWPPGRGPDDHSATTITAAAPAERPAASADIVTDVGGKRRALAFGSQAAPCGERKQWHTMYRCGACGGTHFARSKTELTTGKRLARCGKVVWLVIARNYGSGAVA